MSGSSENPVLTLEVDDQISPGAAAAAASLDNLANSADTVETKVSRVGVSAATLVNRLDPATRSVNAVTAAQNALATQGDTLARGLATGSITQGQYSAAMDTLQARVRAAGEAHDAASGSIEHTGNSTRATTALIRDATKSYSDLVAGMSPLQIAVSSMGNLEHATESFGGVVKTAFEFITSGPGAVIAAGAVFLALGAYAESAESRMLDLQTALKATRTDAESMATEVDLAARGVATSGLGVSLPDATAAAKSLAANPMFQGTQQQLQSLVVTADNLAVVMGETLPAEAVKLAAAMDAPGKMADELATKNFPGMSLEMARAIDLMAQGGDKAGAYAMLLNVVQNATDGAAKASKTGLQTAIDDLHSAFIRTGADGKSFADVLGTSVTNVAAGAVTAIAQLVNGIHAAYDLVNSLHLPSLPNGTLPAIIGQIPVVGNLYNAGQAIAGLAPVAPQTVSPSIAPALNAAASSNGIDPDLLARLQMAEGVQNADGSWQNSPTGAVGPMQVTPTTFRGLQASGYAGTNGLTDVNDPTQNVQAGAVLFAHLLNKYGDPTLAVLAYHDGETVIDNVLAQGGAANASPAAITEAERVLNGYSGNGYAAGASPAINVAGAGNGVVNNPATQIDDALAAAKGPVYDYATAKKEADQYTLALGLLAAQGETSGARVDQLTDALTKAQHAMADAQSPAAKLLETLGRQTDGENVLSAAWANGSLAAADATAQVKAESEARAFAMPGTAAYTDAVNRLTAAHIAEATAQQNATLAAQSFKDDQTIAYLQAEILTLGQSTEARTVYLAALKQQQAIELNEPHASAERTAAVTAEAAAIADLTWQLQQQQAALNEIGNLTTQAFDQVGQALSQAFVSGQGAAVNWGNVTRAIIASVIQELAKLAILNPIINSITGGSATTLGSVISAVGGSASSGGSSGPSALSLVGTGASLIGGGSSILTLLGYQGLGTQLASLLGISGSGIGAAVTGALSAPIFGSAALSSATSSAISGLGAGVYGPATAAQVGLPGVTVGSALGGIGGGFALGSLSGSLVQGALNKSGPAPYIGALGGAVAGAAIGSIIPGVGTVIGGLFGGPLGGTGGGLLKMKVAA
jgi:hypothetical protein